MELELNHFQVRMMTIYPTINGIADVTYRRAKQDLDDETILDKFKEYYKRNKHNIKKIHIVADDISSSKKYYEGHDLIVYDRYYHGVFDGELNPIDAINNGKYDWLDDRMLKLCGMECLHSKLSVEEKKIEAKISEHIQKKLRI